MDSQAGSGNPFDVIGARSAGMYGAWVQRSAKTVFDPWEIKPDITGTNISELAAAITVY